MWLTEEEKEWFILKTDASYLVLCHVLGVNGEKNGGRMSIVQWWGGTSVGCTVWNAKFLLPKC